MWLGAPLESRKINTRNIKSFANWPKSSGKNLSLNIRWCPGLSYSTAVNKSEHKLCTHFATNVTESKRPDLVLRFTRLTFNWFAVSLSPYVSVFQPGVATLKGSWTILEGSRLDTFCTQLYYIYFICVLDGGRCVIMGWCNGSRYEKGWLPYVMPFETERSLFECFLFCDAQYLQRSAIVCEICLKWKDSTTAFRVFRPIKSKRWATALTRNRIKTWLQSLFPSDLVLMSSSQDSGGSSPEPTEM